MQRRFLSVCQLCHCRSSILRISCQHLLLMLLWPPSFLSRAVTVWLQRTEADNNAPQPLWQTGCLQNPKRFQRPLPRLHLRRTIAGAAVPHRCRPMPTTTAFVPGMNGSPPGSVVSAAASTSSTSRKTSQLCTSLKTNPHAWLLWHRRRRPANASKSKHSELQA